MKRPVPARRAFIAGALATPVAAMPISTAADAVKGAADKLASAMSVRHGGKWSAHVDQEAGFVLVMRPLAKRDRKPPVMCEWNAKAQPINEPLLQLWRTVRATWAAEVASEDDGNGPTVAAYRAAHVAFRKVEPTTTLGLFLTLLDSDDGDNFADEHPEAVDAMIAQLQAANVPLAGLPTRQKGGAA